MENRRDFLRCHVLVEQLADNDSHWLVVLLFHEPREPTTPLTGPINELDSKNEHFETLEEAVVAAHAIKHLREYPNVGIFESLLLQDVRTLMTFVQAESVVFIDHLILFESDAELEALGHELDEHLVSLLFTVLNGRGGSGGVCCRCLHSIETFQLLGDHIGTMEATFDVDEVAHMH